MIVAPSIAEPPTESSTMAVIPEEEEEEALDTLDEEESELEAAFEQEARAMAAKRAATTASGKDNLGLSRFKKVFTAPPRVLMV